MKFLTQIIIALIIFNPAITSPALAQFEDPIVTRIISGNTGIGSVMMKGLPGDPVTDKNGCYSATVDYGWSGTITPTKEGYSFVPVCKVYTKVNSDRANDDYAPKMITYTISGRVGLGDVLMRGLPEDPITDNEGIYRVSVPYGWAGVVKPMKEGYTFMPPARSYPKVTADMVNQDYAPRALVEGAGATYGEMMYGGPVPGRRTRQTSTGYMPAIGPMGSRKVLVVPAEEVKLEELAAITEDMQIMSHILDERFKETRRIQGVFTDFGDFFGRDNRQTEATYLQGYGVLFSMEVNFAFSPPPKPQEQGAEQTAENVDSTWQRARQQVFSPGDSRGSGGSDSAEEYNSQMVEELKRDLITTLKHAANIQGVQPDEWIILTVIGGGRQFGGGGFMMGGMGMSGGASYGGTSSGGMSGGIGGGMGGGMMGGMGGGMGGMAGGSMGGQGFGGGVMMGGMEYGEMGSASTTVLTIRVKKSDIDAFAKGQQDFEQFRQNVQTFTY